MIGLLLNILLASSTLAPAREIASLTNVEVKRLAQEIGKSLLKCKQLKNKQNILVDFENRTEEPLDQIELAEITHGVIERRTHLNPNQTQFDYVVKIVLSKNENSKTSGPKQQVYKIKGIVSQSEENLCQKTLFFTKHVNSRKTNGK